MRQLAIHLLCLAKLAIILCKLLLLGREFFLTLVKPGKVRSRRVIPQYPIIQFRMIRRQSSSLFKHWIPQFRFPSMMSLQNQRLSLIPPSHSLYKGRRANSA
jgi:hypothetical protein